MENSSKIKYTDVYNVRLRGDVTGEGVYSSMTGDKVLNSIYDVVNVTFIKE